MFIETSVPRFAETNDEDVHGNQRLIISINTDPQKKKEK